jgi:SAM-dependent methyltransferase
MAEHQIRFDDGAAYERMMGAWSRLAGEIFLDWIAPRPGLRWVDVGCGNGAFTELVVERCAPAEVQGIDPSEGQLAYARARPATRMAEFRQGDAMALPFPDNSFDLAVMALVIFFVPDPAKGVAEMVRVVSLGGTVAAYAWDMAGGGFPLQPVQAELLAMGFAPVRPPRSDASKIDALQNLWTVRGSTALKRGKSRCNERLPISKTFGRQPCWDRRLVRQLPLWWLVIGTSSKRECVHVCRQTVRGASPTAHGQMR